MEPTDCGEAAGGCTRSACVIEPAADPPAELARVAPPGGVPATPVYTDPVDAWPVGFRHADSVSLLRSSSDRECVHVHVRGCAADKESVAADETVLDSAPWGVRARVVGWGLSAMERDWE